MQSVAAARGSQAAGAAAGAGIKTFSRRYTLRARSPKEALAVSSSNATGDDKDKPSPADGKLNFRVRKKRQGVSIVKDSLASCEVVTNLETGEVETSTSPATLKASSSVDASNAKTRVGQRARLKRAPEEQNNVQQSRSNARNVLRKNAGTKVPAPSSIAQESTWDFWHCTLSTNSDAGTEDTSTKISIENAPVAIVPSKSLSAPEDIAVALEHLKSADPLLKTVIDMHEGPKFEKCWSAFTSLARSIMFQQLATKAANAIFGRLVTLCGGLDKLTPSTISQLSVEELRGVGASARKASYLHDLAAKFLSGALSDASIDTLDDEALMTALTAVKGIGVWSVHMFMLFSLHRPDVLPVGDLGVRKGLQKLYQLKDLPSPAQVEKIASRWSPYRSLGSWYMWRVIL